jgi:hypothetical protein
MSTAHKSLTKNACWAMVDAGFACLRFLLWIIELFA